MDVEDIETIDGREAHIMKEVEDLEVIIMGTGGTIEEEEEVKEEVEVEEKVEEEVMVNTSMVATIVEEEM